MKKTSITEAKNTFSALIDRVRRGETVLILDRNRPVARLEPVSSAGVGDESGWLYGLVRDGLVVPAAKPLDRRRLPQPVKPTRPVNIVEALAADREE